MDILNRKERLKSILMFFGLWLVGLLTLTLAEWFTFKHDTKNDSSQAKWSEASKNQLNLINHIEEMIKLKDSLIQLAINDSSEVKMIIVKNILDSIYTEFLNINIIDSLNANNSVLRNIFDGENIVSIVDKISGLNDKPKVITTSGGKEFVYTDKYRRPYFNLKENYNNLDPIVSSITRLAKQAKVSGIPEDNSIYNAFRKINEQLSSYKKIK